MNALIRPIKNPDAVVGVLSNQNKINLSDYLHFGGNHSLSSLFFLVFYFVSFV